MASLSGDQDQPEGGTVIVSVTTIVVGFAEMVDQFGSSATDLQPSTGSSSSPSRHDPDEVGNVAAHAGARDIIVSNMVTCGSRPRHRRVRRTDGSRSALAEVTVGCTANTEPTTQECDDEQRELPRTVRGTHRRDP